MSDENLTNVYDHEVAVLQEVLQTLKDRTFKPHQLEAFDREIRERFGEKGFRVKVNWYDTNQKDVYIPEVEVVGRCEPVKPGEFDHDMQRHEVVNNYLGLPESDAGIIPSGTYTKHEPHKH